MMRGLLLGAAVHGGLASADIGTSVFYTTGTTCSTLYGSGGAAPTPVPISGTQTTIQITVTDSAVTVPASFTTITAPEVTKTEHTFTSSTFAVGTEYSGTATDYDQDGTIVVTATVPQTRCTNGVKPRTTVTKYTGKYTPVPGQSTTLPETYGTLVDCTTAATWLSHLIPSVSSGVSTVHFTPTKVIPDYTTTTTVPSFAFNITTPAVTITITTHHLYGTSVPSTTKVDCKETVTTTLDARCAPTNLIANHNEFGVTYPRNNVNSSGVSIAEEPYSSDRSLCCQLCLDLPNCRASMSDPIFCGLWYQSDEDYETVCDKDFSYTEDPNRLPGSGFIFAAGCGPIEYR